MDITASTYAPLDIDSLRQKFTLVDYGVLGLFLLSSAMIGVFFGWKDRNNKNNKQYLTGDRNLQTFPVVMSLAASFMSTNTILGVPAEVYTLGTQFLIGMFSFTVAVVLSAEVFLPVFYDLNMTSVNEYLFLRFNSVRVRSIGSFSFILSTLPYLAVVLYGPSLALASVTSLSVTKSVIVVGIICTFYTSIGGIKAVIWTDVLQCILMMLGVFMIVAYSFFDEGGISKPFTVAGANGRLKLFDMDVNPYRSDVFLSVFMGTLTTWCGSYCISQTEVQRFCSTKSFAHAKRTLYFNIAPVLFIGTMAIWSGLVIFNRYYQCDPVSMGIIGRHDQLAPYFVMDTMSAFPGIAGLFTACVFSGSLSTLSSGFNSLAAVTWDDFLKTRLPEKWISSSLLAKHLTKLIAAFYGLISLGLAFFIGQLGTVLQASIALSGSTRGPLFALFCLGFFFPFVNAKGAFFGTIIGISTSLVVAIGPIFRPRPKAHLPLYTNNCTSEVYQVYGYQQPRPYILPTEVDPEGIDRLLHISYFYVSVLGFVLTIVIGIAISLATRDPDQEPVDQLLLAKVVRKFAANRSKESSKIEVDQSQDKESSNTQVSIHTETAL